MQTILCTVLAAQQHLGNALVNERNCKQQELYWVILEESVSKGNSFLQQEKVIHMKTIQKRELVIINDYEVPHTLCSYAVINDGEGEYWAKTREKRESAIIH